MVAAPAMAEITGYGSVRMMTFWVQNQAAVGDDDGDLQWNLSPISRFGMQGTTDDISGRVELGFNSGSGGVTTRVLYADYKTDAGTLRMGQWYTHTSLWLSDQAADVETGNIGYGATYDGREPMIRWTMPMGLSIELLEPEASNSYGAADVDVFLPKIGVKYSFKMENVTAELAGAFQTYKLEDDDDDLDGESINSWFVGAYGKGSFGPATVTGTVAYGTNLGNHGVSGGGSAAFVDGTLEDATQYQGWLSVAVAAGPGTATLGGGYQSVDRDDFEDPDAQATYWVQYNYPISKTFFVVPEVTYFDRMDDSNGDEQDDSLWIGMKWHANF
jgi:hypothetical protein